MDRTPTPSMVTHAHQLMKRIRRALRAPRGWIAYRLRHWRGTAHRGYRPICDRSVWFLIQGPWLRDQYLCHRFGSIPRWRALFHVLQTQFPLWRDRAIHECSPGGGASKRIRQLCRGYVGTHYWPEVTPGTMHRGWRCEDRQQQTFADASFDLVITQDVFEHLPRTDLAWKEIARTLKPGGAHLWTVPWFRGRPTLVRAQWADGRVVHLEKPVHHGNPIDGKGSLVFHEWGDDLIELADRHGRTQTQVIDKIDRRLGLDGQFLEVLISRKPSLLNPPSS